MNLKSTIASIILVTSLQSLASEVICTAKLNGQDLQLTQSLSPGGHIQFSKVTHSYQLLATILNESDVELTFDGTGAFQTNGTIDTSVGFSSKNKAALHVTGNFLFELICKK